MFAVLKHFNSVGGAGVVGQYGLKMVLTVSHGLMASIYILKHITNALVCSTVQNQIYHLQCSTL